MQLVVSKSFESKTLLIKHNFADVYCESRFCANAKLATSAFTKWVKNLNSRIDLAQNSGRKHNR